MLLIVLSEWCFELMRNVTFVFKLVLAHFLFIQKQRVIKKYVYKDLPTPAPLFSLK